MTTSRPRCSSERENGRTQDEDAEAESSQNTKDPGSAEVSLKQPTLLPISTGVTIPPFALGDEIITPTKHSSSLPEISPWSVKNIDIGNAFETPLSQPLAQHKLSDPLEITSHFLTGKREESSLSDIGLKQTLLPLSETSDISKEETYPTDVSLKQPLLPLPSRNTVDSGVDMIM